MTTDPVSGMQIDAMASGAAFTCPMYPEIVRDAPGDCPICGMALAPAAGTGEGQADDSELRDLTHRLWIDFALGTPVVLWVGWPILRKFSLAHRELNMCSLIGLGVGLAYLFSLAAVLVPGWFPAEFREHDGAVGTYFEAAAALVIMVVAAAHGMWPRVRTRFSRDPGCCSYPWRPWFS